MSHEIKNNLTEIPDRVAIMQGFNYHHAKEHSGFDEVQDGQTPHAVVTICCDSRVDSNLFGNTFNEIFPVETIGNKLDDPKLSANATYALYHIPETEVLYIVGHTGCGAINGAINNHSNEPEDLKNYLDDMWDKLKEYKNLVDNVSIPSNIKPELFRNALFAEINVDLQVKAAMKRYKPLIDAGKITVIGGMYDIHKIYPVKQGIVHPINIEGIIDENKILNHKYFSKVSKNHTKPFRFMKYNN